MIESPVDVVRAIYEAFGRGDVETVLERIDDDVDWATEAAGAGAPWYGERHGKAAVGRWFAELGAATETRQFDVRSVASSDDEVHTLVRWVVADRRSGREAAMNLHHFFRVRDGRVTFYRGSEDTALLVETLAA